MIKPSAKILQDFARPYFTSSCPVVRWKEMDYKHVAFMDLKKNIICLNPKNGLEDEGCLAGTLKFRPTVKEKIVYKWGEQYFHALLHEIAHFKIKNKPPKEWINLAAKHLTAVGVQENTQRLIRGDKPLTWKEEKWHVINYVNRGCYGNIRPMRKKEESNGNYLARCEDFRNWLGTGDYSKPHVLVEKWARKEFTKRRKEIGELLNKCGYRNKD